MPLILKSTDKMKRAVKKEGSPCLDVLQVASIGACAQDQADSTPAVFPRAAATEQGFQHPIILTYV
jgi:hypothetical protein